jgi:hypothetical protein
MRGIRGGFDPDAFVVVFDTNLRAGSTTVELNINARTGGDRTGDWGDGTVTVENAALPSHTYAADGVYVVQVKGGTTTRLGERGASENAGWTDTLTAVVQWGTLGWTSFERAFSSVKQNFSIPSSIPTSVTNLGFTFNGASAFNQPSITLWNTVNITNMAGTIRSSGVNQNISQWNVSNVTTFNLFANLASSFNQNLGAWALRLAGVNLASMFNSSGLSTENYSRTLIGWANYAAANGNLPASVTLGATGRTYNATVYVPAGTYTNAVDARAFLSGVAPDPAWTITDAGLV